MNNRDNRLTEVVGLAGSFLCTRLDMNDLGRTQTYPAAGLYRPYWTYPVRVKITVERGSAFLSSHVYFDIVKKKPPHLQSRAVRNANYLRNAIRLLACFVTFLCANLERESRFEDRLQPRTNTVRTGMYSLSISDLPYSI